MPAPSAQGILVFPEWGGVGEYTHKRAQMLGELGFNAFVVDVYGKGIRPNTPQTCEAEMMKYATDRPLLRRRARCGLGCSPAQVSASLQLGTTPDHGCSENAVPHHAS